MNWKLIPELDLGVRNNSRLLEVPYISTFNESLINYQELNPINESISSTNPLLSDGFKSIYDYLNTVPINYDEFDKLFICNYIYKYKGSIQSIFDLCRMTGVILDSIGTSLNQSTGELTIVINRVYTNDLDKFKSSLTEVAKELLYFDDMTPIEVKIVIMNLQVKVYSEFRYKARNVLNLTDVQTSVINID